MKAREEQGAEMERDSEREKAKPKKFTKYIYSRENMLQVEFNNQQK